MTMIISPFKKYQLPACCVVFFFLLSCSGRKNENIDTAAAPDSSAVKRISINEDSALRATTTAILTLLREKKYKDIVKYVHSTAGVRFSPYGYIDTVRDQVFTRQALEQQLNSKDSLIQYWGAYDGSGDSINLTLPAYLGKFVYDVDFLNAEHTSVDSIMGMGNSLNNLAVVYKGDRFTESHFPGFDPKYSGMDWRSLRLVYRKENSTFYLVGIIHDQWTT